MSQSTGRTVAKNASWLMISQLFTWGISMVLTIFFARYLGAEGVGQFHLANSLWAIAATIAGFGMDTLLVKEIARRPEKLNALFGTSFVLRVLLFGLAALGVLLYGEVADYSATTLYVIAIIGVTNLNHLYATTVELALRGLERMEFVSIGSVILRALWAVTAISLLLLGYDIAVVASASVVTSLIYVWVMHSFLRRVQAIRFSFDRATAVWMLKTGYTYFVVSVFVVLYHQIDTVVISLLADEKTVGWYGAADQLFGTLLFIPTVLLMALFPAMSRMHEQDPASAAKVLNKGFDMLLLFGVPIGLGTVVIAQPFVVLLFGDEFIPSGPVLAVLGFVLILTYQNALLGQYCISIDKQRFWAWVMVVATLATIPLDLVLIPWCVSRFGNGAIGGALAYLVTESGMIVAALLFLPKGTFGWRTVWMVTRIGAAGLLMAGFTWFVRDYFIAIPIVIGAIVYLAFILLFRVIQAEDWELLNDLRQRVLDRIRNRSLQPAG